MRMNRFEDYNEEVEYLVKQFESAITEHRAKFFDLDELDIIICFYLETGDVVMMEESVNYAEKLYPEVVSVRLHRAQLLGIMEKFDQSLFLLQELEQVEPDNEDVKYTMGVVYSQKCEHEKAIYYYKQLLHNGNDLENIYENIAGEYMQL